MVAAERIRFSQLILLSVVLNAVARSHLVKCDENGNGSNRSVIDGLITTTGSSTSLRAEYAATSDFTAGPELLLSSSAISTTDTSVVDSTNPDHTEGLSHYRNEIAGAWCLKLVADVDGTESNEIISQLPKDVPTFLRYPFTVENGRTCGTFDPPSHKQTYVQLLNVTVSWISKSEIDLCVEFASQYDTYVNNISIAGTRFPERDVRPGELVVVERLKRCSPWKYTVTVKCQTGPIVSKVVEHESEQFPIKLEGISPAAIQWSFPVEALPCLREFRVDLDVSTAEQRSKTSFVVPKGQENSGKFNLTLQDPAIICFGKNVTITPISEDSAEGSPITEYSDVDLSIDPKVMYSSVNFTQYEWDTSDLFGKCVKQVTVFDGSKFTTIMKRKKKNTFPRRATFRNLDACRLYNFTFEVIDLNGMPRSAVTRNITMMNVVEDSVVDLHVIENETPVVCIGWKPPEGMAHCIKSYLIEERYYGHEFNTSSRLEPVWLGNQTTFCRNEVDICSPVSISVSPILLNGSRWKSSTLNQSSTDAVENLRIHPMSPRAVNITWNPPRNSSNCVEYYLVYMEEFPHTVWNTAFTSITVDHLIPCYNYSFVVVPKNRLGFNHSSAMASISMPENRITQLRQVESRIDEIQWRLSPLSYSCIKEFQVVVKSANDNTLMVTKTVSANIKAPKSVPITYRFRKTSETPCAVLSYSIIPVSLSGQLGDPLEISTPRPKPGPVRDVIIDTSVKREVTLSWTKPNLFPECISSYLISYDDRNVTALVNESSVTIQNLESCVEYNFTIATVDFSGEEAASVVVNATVKEEKLSGVQDLELTEQDPRSLIARWKPPANGTYCVASYRYVAWGTGEGALPEQISDSTTDMHVTFVEVFACTKYNVQVIPVSKGSNDGNNEIAEIVTKERVILRYHIDPVRIKNQMAQSLELQTALTNDNNNNCQLLAVRFSCTTNIVPEGADPPVITGETDIADLNATFSAVVTPLQPYSEYNCSAAILNIAGWSDETAMAPFMTGEDFPEQPQNLQLRGDFRMIELRWEAPKVKNGIISRYRVHIRSEGARYPTPSYCPLPAPYNSTFDLHEEDDNARLSNWDKEELDHKILYLNPYTDYVVQVAAATKAGLGPYTEMVSVATLPEQPEPVYEFSEYNVTLPEIDKPYNSTVHISWKIPCQLYGRLRSFTGQFVGYKDAIEHTFSWARTINSSEEIFEKYSLLEERLEPELQYNVSIMIFVEDVANHSDAKFLSFLSPAGIPNITHEINWGSVNVMDAPNPTKTARIWISDIIFQSNVGSITNVALLVSERHCQADPVPERNLSIEWPDVLSWRVAAKMPCIPQYQTTPKQWNPVEGRQTPEVEYIIGKDHCEESQEYCNGALKPGTEYALIVRIFTNSGYSDSAIQFFETDSLIQLTVIVTSIFVCLLLAFSLGLVILWRTQKLTLSPLAAVRSPNEEPADIPLKSFSGIYEELIQSNREKINKEYQAINFFSEQLISEKVTFFVAKENERKNRYLGIFPYDGNRVPLDVDDMFVEEEEGSNDYINASFIDGYKYQREYIATQGPKKETCFDFWRMILQYEVESIVMLTQTVENDRIKCYQYFPRFNQTFHFREVSVKCTQELNMGFYQKRLFLVTRDNISKAVFHYHFLTWPDHGCPSSASDLIKFIKIIRSERKNLALPVVVHCSAGVGRTGTLIALDIILQRIQQEKKINIYDTVKQLRTQRVKMVQTSEQYAFLYHACLEYTTRNNRKKPKTSTEEISPSARSSPDKPGSVAPKNGRRPMINIKFPKYVHSGISNVKSYAPDDVESKT